MKQLILESLVFVIPIYSGIGILAFKRPNRYANISKALTQICFAFMAFCLVWNISGTYFLSLVGDTEVDYEIISKVSEVHSINSLYSFFIPLITVGYIIFLQEISKPDSTRPNNQKEELKE